MFPIPGIGSDLPYPGEFSSVLRGLRRRMSGFFVLGLVARGSRGLRMILERRVGPLTFVAFWLSKLIY